MYVFGADENGLGPLLGPLVATAVVLEVDAYRAKRLAARGLAEGFTDSKEVSGFGRMKVTEGVALALAERELGHVPDELDVLLEAIALDGPLARRAPCPDDASARQCFATPIPLPAYGGDVVEGRARLRALEGRGTLRVRRVRTALACVGALNAAADLGRSKLTVDLSLFERLLLDASASVNGAALDARCGMVGGIRDYPRYATLLAADAWRPMPLEEGDCAYEVEGLGQVRFERKADVHHLPVAIASMVGKYVRELTMDRIVRFHRAIDPTLEEVSGYRDPRTQRFAEQVRRALPLVGVSRDCFERR